MNKRHILVMDNDEEYVMLLSRVLTDKGYAVVPRRLKEDSILDLVKQQHPDLIILDPSIDETGIDWRSVQLLRLDPETKRIPLILCTANWDGLWAEAGSLMLMGVTTLHKPFTVETLLQRVQEALHGTGP